jgi:hypothetical protein
MHSPADTSAIPITAFRASLAPGPHGGRRRRLRRGTGPTAHVSTAHLSTAHVSTAHVSTAHLSTAHLSTAHLSSARVADEIDAAKDPGDPPTRVRPAPADGCPAGWTAADESGSAGRDRPRISGKFLP